MKIKLIAYILGLWALLSFGLRAGNRRKGLFTTIRLREKEQVSKGLVCLTGSIQDISSTFNPVEKFFFQRFSIAVSQEINFGDIIPSSYTELIRMISNLTYVSPSKYIVNDRSKRMLINLFPTGLLPAYKVLFGRIPAISGVMNTWVTHWTTTWLMGPSQVESYEVEGTKERRKNQRLLIKKCRFLEESGCIQVCLHACKIPTQRFFYEEMGLPVTLSPNFTDLSCRFDFNKFPIDLVEDRSLEHPCLASCAKNRQENAS